MSRPDKVYTRFRGVVAADLTGQFGSDDDLIAVAIDGNGQLVAAGAGAAKGVIWTPEGKANPDVANFNVATAGSVMTVFVDAEFVETGFEAGDQLRSAASGNVSDSTGAQVIGFVVDSDEGGDRLVLRVTGGTA